jgi:hypothetical protein
LISVVGKTDMTRIATIVLGGILISCGTAFATGLFGAGG